MARRDDAEFAAFAAGSRTALRRTAYLLCGDWDRASDLVQEALVRVYVAWPRLERKGGLGAYARRAVVSAAIDAGRRRSSTERPTEHDDTVASPEDVATAVADRQALMAALARLPQRQRACVVLRYFEDLAVGEVARVLGCAEGTVKSQTARGLDSLRAMFEDDGGLAPRRRDDGEGTAVVKQLVDLMREATEQPPAETWSVPELVGAGRRRVRRRRVAVTGGAALAAVVVGAAVVVPTTLLGGGGGTATPAAEPPGGQVLQLADAVPLAQAGPVDLGTLTNAEDRLGEGSLATSRLTPDGLLLAQTTVPLNGVWPHWALVDPVHPDDEALPVRTDAQPPVTPLTLGRDRLVFLGGDQQARMTVWTYDRTTHQWLAPVRVDGVQHRAELRHRAPDGRGRRPAVVRGQRRRGRHRQPGPALVGAAVGPHGAARRGPGGGLRGRRRHADLRASRRPGG